MYRCPKSVLSGICLSSVRCNLLGPKLIQKSARTGDNGRFEGPKSVLNWDRPKNKYWKSVRSRRIMDVSRSLFVTTQEPLRSHPALRGIDSVKFHEVRLMISCINTFSCEKCLLLSKCLSCSNFMISWAWNLFFAAKNIYVRSSFRICHF